VNRARALWASAAAALLAPALAGCLGAGPASPQPPTLAPEVSPAERAYVLGVSDTLGRLGGALARVDRAGEQLAAGALNASDWGLALEGEGAYLQRLAGDARDAVVPAAFRAFHFDLVRLVDRAAQAVAARRACGPGACPDAAGELQRVAAQLCDLDADLQVMARTAGASLPEHPAPCGVGGAPAGDQPGTVPHPFRGLAPRAYVATTKGTFVVELALEMVPRTVQNFMALGEQGFYDGTKFHRVARNSFIQGGDPNTRSGPRDTWGKGDAQVPPVPDEFHPLLRHDAPGTVSMATNAPDNGRSQFYITLVPTPALDDRFTVFGKVVSGMEVVEAIGAGAIVGGGVDGQPADPVAITKVTIVRPTPDPERVVHGVQVVPVLAQKVTDGTRNVTFAAVVKNTGTVRDAFQLAALAPPGWAVALERGRVSIPAGTATVVLAEVAPPPGATEGASVQLLATSEAEPLRRAQASVGVALGSLGGSPRDGGPARADWAGLLADGRLFDTNLEALAGSQDLPRMSSSLRIRSAYEPYDFTLDASVVPGFRLLALRTRVGEASLARVPWPDAYAQGTRDSNPLFHKDVVFELRLLAAG
jgi:cyclophilin family peptidyl-prolyl cis-trans isomerase